MSTGAVNWAGQTLLGRYDVRGALGEGGMAYVYRAYDRNLDCDVVIKVPRPSAMEDPEFAQRFARETRSLVRLTHPRIVKVLDVGEHDRLPFAVMQFLAGGSLEDRLKALPAGRARTEEALLLRQWLPAMAEAIDFIHEQGYVHRDVKPTNLLFDAHGHVYLSDFGIAKALGGSEGRQATALTGKGIVLGTPEYMAPEVIMGRPYDGRADQYALAVTVYQSLSGRTLFEAATPAALLVMHTTEEAPPLHRVLPGAPRELSKVLARALQKDPRERFATCEAMARAVLDALAGERPDLTPAQVRRPRRAAELVEPVHAEPARPEPARSEPAKAEPAKVEQPCPACRKTFRMPGSVIGKRVKCPACLAVFVAYEVALPVEDDEKEPAWAEPAGAGGEDLAWAEPVEDEENEVAAVEPVAEALPARQPAPGPGKIGKKAVPRVKRTCPRCGNTVPIPVSLLGKHVRCPGCRGVFVTPPALPQVPDTTRSSGGGTVRLPPRPRGRDIPPPLKGPPNRPFE
jgi:serine/threonine-protein kinase